MPKPRLPGYDRFGDFLKAGSGLPVVGPGIEVTVDSLKAASDLAQQILDDEFVPAFESKLRKFNDDVCQKNQDDLRTLWNEFTAASDCVPRNPFNDVPPLFAT